MATEDGMRRRLAASSNGKASQDPSETDDAKTADNNTTSAPLAAARQDFTTDRSSRKKQDDEGDEKTEKAKKKAPRGRSRKDPPPLRWDEILSMLMTVFTAAVTVASTYYIVQQMRHRDTSRQNPTSSTTPSSSLSSRQPGADRLFTADELSRYDGSDPSLPLLLGCIGEVFDVTAGKKHYGKGEGYNHFCGRDASRAFVSGNFSGEGLTDDLSHLSYDNLVGVAGWRDFYHKTYKYAGKLVGRFYNESGQPTKNLTRFERHLKRAKAEKAKQEAEDKKYVGCNSYWSAKDGGRVYCEKGYPRMMFSVMSTGHGQSTKRTRCICLGDDEIGVRPDLKEYDNCEPWSQSCQTSPPEENS